MSDFTTPPPASADFIPAQVDDITVDWLNAVLGDVMGRRSTMSFCVFATSQ